MVKKLNPVDVQAKLIERELLLFTPREFCALFAVSGFAARKFIHHYVQKGLFIKLRNGLYVLQGKQPSPHVIANKLYQPSYISLETALSFYHLIPEVVYSITSVTTKATREFSTLGQSFSYTRLKKNAFQGYQLTTTDTDRFLIAEPEKALVDYLYLVALGQKTYNDRLRLERVNQDTVLHFAHLFAYPRLITLIHDIYAHHAAN